MGEVSFVQGFHAGELPCVSHCFRGVESCYGNAVLSGSAARPPILPFPCSLPIRSAGEVEMYFRRGSWLDGTEMQMHHCEAATLWCAYEWMLVRSGA